MEIGNVELSLKLPLAILKFLPHLVKTLWNYCNRPKLRLSIANTYIEFCTHDGQIQCPSFPSIRIENTESSNVTLDLNKAFINGEALSYIIQQNIFFSKTSEQNTIENKLTTNNKLINLFRENWTTSKFIQIAAHETLDIPIYPKGMDDSMYFKVLNEARILFPKGKIVIILTVNSRTSHYAISRIQFLKVILNNLVHNRH
jgi:hypothetical protein